jgi:transcriptional regulator GlxA family with amidase domain
MQAIDDLYNAPDEDIPTAIPGLINAAVAAFDADRDTSRRYLLRASALLCVKRVARTGVESARHSESRGGLLAWQLNRVLDYVEMHLADKITVMDLAGLTNVSIGRLSRAFKISVGVSPGHYIAKRRVDLACKMMRTTGHALAQIAVACGLCDQPHLCKLFRRIVGMSPSAWRRATPIRDMSTADQGHSQPMPSSRTPPMRTSVAMLRRADSSNGSRCPPQNSFNGVPAMRAEDNSGT